MRPMKSMIAALMLVAAFAGAASTASAQAPEGVRVRVRGTIDTLEGGVLTVKSPAGQLTKVAFPDNTGVVGMARRTLADIKPNDFIGVTSTRGADGRMQAVEVHIFPEAMRGTGEGQYDWDLLPQSTMTNGSVTGSVAASDGQTLKVNYKGGESEITVGPKTEIVSYVPGDKSLLVPGAHIVVLALKQPDGAMSALRVNAEKDGVRPPM